ncbi:MAG TPA: HAD family hydrolase [Chloroflexota bacterium]|nr:HAD family hydrolase [Chloroflexota bacterium]
MSMPRALLFDLYDTLIWLDTDKSNRYRQQFATRIGLSLEQFLRHWRQSIDHRMLGKGEGLPGHLATALSEMGIEPEPELISDLVEIERERLEQCAHPYPSTFPVLNRLSAEGYTLGLLSNVSDGAAIPITFLGIDKLFDRMVLSHEVGLLKPDPAIYRLACEQLDVAPTETVFVADGGFGELDASYEMGIFSVMLEQDNQSRDYGFSTRYHAKIHDLSELESLLSRLRDGDSTGG